MAALGTAERQLRAAEFGGVDPDHPGGEPVGDGRDQAVLGAVGDRDRLAVVLDHRNRCDRAEDLLRNAGIAWVTPTQPRLGTDDPVRAAHIG
jgi:hypothetical protein